MSIENINGFEVHMDLAYAMDTHMWVEVRTQRCVRIGMDALGVETSGTLAQLRFGDLGAVITCGADMGSLEAEKFVGPLVAPLSGTVTAVNRSAVDMPSIVERDPFGDGWMVEINPTALAEELSKLTSGREGIIAEFTTKVLEYRRDGVLAE